MELDIFNIKLIKYTGIAAYPVEVNSIAFKTVDYATYLDSTDAMNYAVNEPYGKANASYSYENWIKFKLDLNCRFKKYLTGEGLELTFMKECKCAPPEEETKIFTKIKNVAIWVEMICNDDAEITYGVAKDYRRPVKTKSDIAIKNIKEIQSRKYNNTKVEIIPITDEGSLVDFDSFESDFFVTQLCVLKGGNYQLANNVISLKLHYELA